MADIGRPEEAEGFCPDPRLLDSYWGGAPKPEAVVMVMIGVTDEYLPVPDEPRRLSVTESFVGFGEPKTEGAQGR